MLHDGLESTVDAEYSFVKLGVTAQCAENKQQLERCHVCKQLVSMYEVELEV